MNIDLPGLIREDLPSGNTRWRVRVAGNKRKRITLAIPPDHPDFLTHYHAARRGLRSEAPKQTDAVRYSLAWLMDEFERWMETEVAADRLDTKTLKQRRAFYARLREPYGRKHMAMPVEAVVTIRNSMAETPGAADNMVKALRAMFAWAMQPERRLLDSNPTTGIAKINRGTGATPWSVNDMKRFRERHPAGTMAHLALSLFMFTACRIEDVVRFGRGNEVTIDGVRSLHWQPAKKGSRPVTVPILPPLERALRAQKVIGPTYLLRHDGKPFASAGSFDNWFRKRIIEAGLCANGKATRSSHGIRKAAGEILALEGATQYHIMAVHGHASARTSEVYTAGVNRQQLARDAMLRLGRMEW